MKELRGHIRSVLIGFIVLFLILGAYIGYHKRNQMVCIVL